MKQLTAALALALLFAPALASSEAGKSSQSHPDLSGEWTLNQAMSEDAREKMKELMSGRRAGRGGFGGPEAGTGRGGRPGIEGWGPRRGSSDGRGQGARGALPADFDQGIDALSVSQSADQLSITYSDERLRILFTDGRKDERTGPIGKVVTKARWSRDGALEVKSKRPDGKTTEIYRLDRDSERLLVDITVAGPMGEITLLRTYDRLPGETVSEGDR